jgi:dTDP-4-dehydrorhamnose 3,5-epimerase
MIYTPTPLSGAFLIELEPIEDLRGFFARVWCRDDFAAHGIAGDWVQSSMSFNRKKGTFRGMHYQAPPHEEAKLVRCTRGALYDVIVDLRPDSPTYRRHFGTVLSAENRRSLYIPAPFAHGFLVLEDDTEVSYHMTAAHNPASARGFRWDDAAFGIEWPEPILVMSEADRRWPPFAGLEVGSR